jgi:pentatricopeptide repeat protein
MKQLQTRLQQGFSLDSYMFVEVLKRCLKQKDLRATKEVHECIIESGMEQDVYVATNLLKVYIGCGRLQEARWVFDELLNKNVFSWTIMIGGYAHHNRAEDAMEVFHQMCQEDVQPNEVTYLSILKAFITPSALKWDKEVHAHIKHDGLESDLRVGSALVHMYAKTGSIDDARLVFDRMEDRNVITWSAMIGGLADHGRGHEAYELFLRMQRDGFEPDAITCISILNACASAGALEWVKEVHRHVLKARLGSDLRVASALVHMYAKSGSIDDARLVFYRMEDRNVITWNIMIGGLADHGCGHEAYELFLQMQRGGCVPNANTYMSILNACAIVGALEWVKVIHRHVLEAGLESELRVGNALVHSYAKSGSIDDAQLVFDRMEDRDVITWNMLIGGLADHGHEHKAYELFLQMQREGYVPNAITFVSILNACASEGALEWVKEVHRHVLEAQLGSDLRVGSALVHSYVKSGSIDDARLVSTRWKIAMSSHGVQ